MLVMNYMTVADAAKKWGLTPRNVQIHCEKGNIPGTTLIGKAWRIPADAERPRRKPRAKGLPSTVLGILKAEKRGRISGGLYHRLQIDFTYNTNHMEGSRLTHEQTRWIFETMTLGSLPGDVPLDTCRTGQDVFVLGLRQFGHAKLAEKAEKEVSSPATP